MLTSKKGFTLIELIIVMAIIGVLAVVGIVAISGKAQDARNAKRKADVSTLITAFNLYCSDTPEPIDCTNDGNNLAVASTCSNPGKYIKLSTVNDPTKDGISATDRCTTLNTGCNYTLVLISGQNKMDQCNPNIIFSLEEGNTYKSACARNTGVEFDLNSTQFEECISGL